jgi:flagellar basal body-associated protein FliL
MKNEKGYILVISLLMLLVITALAMGIITASTYELKIAGNKRATTNSLYSTDGSVQLVISNSENFLISKFDGNNKYNPYSDPKNQNPVNSTSAVTYFPDRVGCPRGLGYSSTNFEFEYFEVSTTGKDQVEKQATTSIQEDLTRLVPVIQGGN